MKLLPKILDLIEHVPERLKNPDRTNSGTMLWEIYIWQEMSRRTKKRLEKAWAKAQDQGILPSDEVLRSERGERTVSQTEKFCVVVNTGEPRIVPDQMQFIQRLAKKYKLDEVELMKLSAKCVSKSKPVLTKRVTEKE